MGHFTRIFLVLPDVAAWLVEVARDSQLRQAWNLDRLLGNRLANTYKYGQQFMFHGKYCRCEIFGATSHMLHVGIAILLPGPAAASGTGFFSNRR
jgi:hypothetical protein